MTYIYIFISLVVLELVYFEIAKRLNIVDRPNQRSSHETITLRGGGIVFYFGALTFFFLSDFQYSYFFLGLTMMTVISFLDDIYSLSNKIRLLIHFVSVLLMAYQLDVFEMPWYYMLITLVVVVGVINAYNFMDGINGITASYSLAVCGLLLLVNEQLGFIKQDLIVSTMIGVIVFAFFNFRTNARCFAGDVGSVSISYILLFVLGALIIKSENLIYFLFLSVYGTDAIWTIIRRLYLRENIFEAHRSHLYQILGNEAGVNKLFISFIYGALQFLIGLIIIFVADQGLYIQLVFSAVLLVGLSVVYLLIKNSVMKQHVTGSNSES